MKRKIKIYLVGKCKNTNITYSLFIKSLLYSRRDDGHYILGDGYGCMDLFMTYL